jgi:hypothetical protein
VPSASVNTPVAAMTNWGGSARIASAAAAMLASSFRSKAKGRIPVPAGPRPLRDPAWIISVPLAASASQSARPIPPLAPKIAATRGQPAPFFDDGVALAIVDQSDWPGAWFRQVRRFQLVCESAQHRPLAPGDNGVR